jgi:hypothetical protein
MSPITGLLKKFKVFEWTKECQIVWEEIKNLYVQVPIFFIPNWELEFHVHTWSTHLIIGAILAQNPTSKFDQPVMYTSRLLHLAECNYNITQREVLAMVYAFTQIQTFLTR